MPDPIDADPESSIVADIAAQLAFMSADSPGRANEERYVQLKLKNWCVVREMLTRALREPPMPKPIEGEQWRVEVSKAVLQLVQEVAALSPGVRWTADLSVIERQVDPYSTLFHRGREYSDADFTEQKESPHA